MPRWVDKSFCEGFVDIGWIGKWLHHSIPAPCVIEGSTYSTEGGETCFCDEGGSLQCTTSTDPGCYCASDSYENAEGVCALRTECQCKWLNDFTFLWHDKNREWMLYFTAICEGGTVYTEPGATICVCPFNGELECSTFETSGCFCPPDQFLNTDSVCTPNDGCARE